LAIGSASFRREALSHAAQVNGGQASRLSSSGGRSEAARARLPGRSGEDKGAEAGRVAATVAGARESTLLDEVSQLNPDRAPITPLGLGGGEYAFRLLLLVPMSPSARKHMPVASEMTLAHSATSSCGDASDNSSII
jgi:hypothetical protein